jgi:peptidoglycan/LPS O-acetylase OafA/YrhL
MALENRLISAGHRPDIDGLRGVAVVSVLLFHGFPKLLPAGFVGVDIFFVISGYLISSQILAGLQRGDFSFRVFYARRARRLLPALFLVLAFSAVAGWQLLMPPQLAALGRDILAGLIFTSNVVFWNDAGYFDAPSATKPLLHLWSLGIEEQFYLLWPIALVVAFRYQRVALLIGGVIAASFACNVLLIATNHQSAAFYLPFSRFWELLAGAAIVNVRTRSNVGPVAGMALIALSLVLVHETHFPGWKALAPVAGTMMIIAGAENARVNRALGNRVLVALGLISYPLYMWHWPLLTFARIFNVEPLSQWQTASLLLASVALAAATFICVERPIKQFARFQRISFGLSAAVLSVFAIASIATGGFIQRLPAIIRDIQSPPVDRVAWRDKACFLGVRGGTFSPACLDRDPSNAPIIALWGDSHAAALYPGLLALKAGHQFRIHQMTSSSCPPIVNLPDPTNVSHCTEDNSATLAKLRSEKNPPSLYWMPFGPNIIYRCSRKPFVRCVSPELAWCCSDQLQYGANRYLTASC